MTVSMTSMVIIALMILRVMIATMIITIIVALIFIGSGNLLCKRIYNGGPRDNDKSICSLVLKAKNFYPLRQA